MSNPVELPRILCVDDDPDLLVGLTHTLRRRFEVHTAGCGAEGLKALEQEGPFTVVLSDYLMPGMDGAAFLAQARKRAPDTVRMLLTGHANLDGAVAAVNLGNIFRFLLKPCSPDVLVQAVEDGVEQARLVTADRLLLERRLDEISGQLLEAERLATLGTMAGAVGHELGNMVAAFDTTLYLISGDAAEGKAPAATDLDTLRRVRAHLASHARNLLHLGRPDRQGAQSSDLCAVITDTVAMLRTAGVLRHTEVRLDLPEAGVPVPVPRTRLEQVLVNLLKNAVDAMTEAGRKRPSIAVKVTRRQVEGGWQADCQVADNGCGIPPEKLEAVFEAYYTTKPPDRGTGLGLFVIRQIVAGAQGSLRVSSELGKGSTFHIQLPVGEALPVAPAAPAPLPPPPQAAARLQAS